MKTIPATSPVVPTTVLRSSAAIRRRALWSGCIAHAPHDGYTDLIYVLLPVWQGEFGLGFESLAVLRSVYAATMAGLQWPAGRLAERVGGRAVLVGGTGLAALGYLLAGFSGGLFGLGIALSLSGFGSSAQHPIAASTISRVYGKSARGPLGIYNFSGDLGKAALPAAASVLLIFMTWRHALWIVSFTGFIVAAGLACYMPATANPTESVPIAVAPILYGMLGDSIGVFGATIATAITALATVPCVIALVPHLPHEMHGQP